jgi:hypothetical protein
MSYQKCGKKEYQPPPRPTGSTAKHFKPARKKPEESMASQIVGEASPKILSDRARSLEFCVKKREKKMEDN